MKKEKINKKYYKKYIDFIDKIIKKHGRFRKTKENKKFERHHIKPKCIGGSDSIKNLIDLTYVEHLEAHKLLAEAHPKNAGLSFAYYTMMHNKNRKKLSKKEYNIAKQHYSKTNSENAKKLWENSEYRKKVSEGISKGLMGRKLSLKSRKKIAKGNKEYQKNMPKKERDRLNKILSEKLSGKNNPMYGVHRKISKKQKKLRSKYASSSKWWTNNKIEKFTPKKPGKDFKRGRLKRK